MKMLHRILTMYKTNHTLFRQHLGEQCHRYELDETMPLIFTYIQFNWNYSYNLINKTLLDISTDGT